MRVDGSFPNHVSRAYGLKLVRPPVDAAKAARPQNAQAVQATAKITPSSSVQSSAKVSQLIAGKVAGPVDFSSGPRAATASDALSLYSRSADRIEAATAVQLGRQLDVKA